MVKTLTSNLREKVERYGNIFIALSLALSGFMPIILTAQADAAQLTGRKVTISSSQAGATGVTYTFDLLLPPAARASNLLYLPFVLYRWVPVPSPLA